MSLNPGSDRESNTLVGREVEFFDPSHYAIGLIQQAVVKRQNVGISGCSIGELYIFPDRGEYVSLILDNSEFFTLPAGDLRVRPLGKEEVKELVTQVRYGRNIDELMWLAAQIASNGRLMAGCKASDVIHLKHWPSFTRLPLNPNTLRLAALFSRSPTSLFVASRMLGIQQWEINEFYSAAKAAGLADTVNRPADLSTQNLKQYHNRSLLEKIIDRISSL